MLRGLQIFDGGAQRRVLPESELQCIWFAGRKIGRQSGWREQHSGGRFANQADETGRDIMQIGGLGIQVQFGKCQATGGVFHIHPPTGAALRAAQ
jgi:hypothetical protein